VTRDVEVFIDRVGHDQDVWVTCPEPLSGTFHLMCSNARYTHIDGVCGERCPVESVSIPGALFQSVQTDHLEKANYTCSEGYSGLVITTCSFGTLTFNNTCSADCVAGVARVNGLNISHGAIRAWEVKPAEMCPSGYTGSIALTCMDAVVHIASGECSAYCEPGSYVEDAFEVGHPAIDHGVSLEQPCPSPFSGSLLLHCHDGNVSRLGGACYEDCRQGNYTLRPGVVHTHGHIGHGENITGFTCPSGFFGTFTLSCLDGIVSSSDMCLAGCQPAEVLGASHGLLAHDELATLPCRASGEMTVRCYDGSVQVLAGYCFRHCAAGSTKDANNVLIEHGDIEPNRTAVGQCSGLSTGTVTLLCNDGAVEEQPLPGDGCLRGCPATTATTADGASVEVPTIEHGAWLLMSCPDDELGVLTISCADGEITVDGKCGSDNCPAGEISDAGALLEYPNMNHGSEVGPFACGGDGYVGEASISCNFGVTRVARVTLLSSSWPTVGPYVNDTQLFPEEDRFTLCECCLPLETPPEDTAASQDETGILVWVTLIVAALCLAVAFAVGFVVFMQAQQMAANNSLRKVMPVDDVEAAKTADAEVAKPPKQILDAEAFTEPSQQLEIVVAAQADPASAPEDAEQAAEVHEDLGDKVAEPQDAVEMPELVEMKSDVGAEEPAEPAASQPDA